MGFPYFCVKIAACNKSLNSHSGEVMIRKLRTERDNQQWMLDLALNLRGRVQNFERDDLEVPAGKRARNYRMLPKVWRETEGGHEAPAKLAPKEGAQTPTPPPYEIPLENHPHARPPTYYI